MADQLQNDFPETSSRPRKIRFQNPEQVFWAYDQYKNADPQREKRAAILKAYYRYPHAIQTRDRQQCLLREPSSTNYGMLSFLVDRNKTAYMDMIHSRKHAFQITSEYVSPKEKGKEGFSHRKQWSDLITYAFERFYIKEWDGYTYNQELVVNDMQLYGRSLEFWPHVVGARSEYLAVERCYPNVEASHIVADWDSVAIEYEMTNQDLWDLANQEGSGFNKENVAAYLKRNCEEFRRKTESDVIRELEDGNWDYSIASRTSELVYFFSKEYEKVGGNQISMHVIPRNYGEVGRSRGRRSELGFLAERTHYRPSMDTIVAVIVDDVGHGKYYNTPSFAEKLYVASKTYDQKMNKAGDAAEINCMLMTEGPDANSGAAMTKQVFRDRIHFLPGTRPSQVRYQLPVEESISFAQRVFMDARSNAGIYQISDTNLAGGKTPKTATQANLDFQESGRISSANLKRFVSQLTIWGREMYRRFLELSEADPGGDGLRRFKKFLKENDVPEKAYAPENVMVEAKMVLAAGSNAAKFQTAVTTLNILNTRPTSRGQRIAQEEAIAALNGIDNASAYFDDTEFLIPTDEDRLIGHENEEMRDSGFRGYNLQVHDSDNHVLHLMGSTREGGGTVGHIDDAFESLKQGIQMTQIDAPPSDVPILADKIANIIAEVSHKLNHSSVHVQFLQADSGKRATANEAQNTLAEMKRQLDLLTNLYEQIQKARMEQQGEGSGASESEQKAAIEIQKKQALAEIELASRMQQHEAKMEQIQREGDIKRKGAVDKIALEKIKDEQPD